jgi:hypothetical protein
MDMLPVLSKAEEFPQFTNIFTMRIPTEFIKCSWASPFSLPFGQFAVIFNFPAPLIGRSATLEIYR